MKRTEGLFSHNPVFVAGMSVTPAVAVSATFDGAYTYAVIFSALTFISLMTASFLPRSIPYALRVILYSFIAAIFYIPVYISLSDRLPALAGLGVLLPMIATDEFVVSASETRFFRKKRSEMITDVIFHILGFDIAVILLGIIREVLSSGELAGNIVGVAPILPLLSSPCGGFILIGLFAALVRKLC